MSENLPSTKLNYDDAETLATLRATIAPDATAPEFQMFISFCKATGLNPYKKEIWFIKTKPYTKKNGERIEGKVQMMTGINGFYAIANNHPQYDGMEEIEFLYNDKKQIISAKARVWRKDRRFPSVGIALWDEYAPEPNEYNKNSIWFTKPSMMIGKVAESIGLRKAFPQELNGLYTQEEMPADFDVKAAIQAFPKKKKEPDYEPSGVFIDGKTGEVIEDNVPDSFNKPKANKSLEKVKDAIDGDDMFIIGDHVIETKGTTYGMTVRDAVKKYQDKIEHRLPKFLEADRLAIQAFMDFKNGMPANDPQFTDEDLGLTPNV